MKYSLKDNFFNLNSNWRKKKKLLWKLEEKLWKLEKNTMDIDWEYSSLKRLGPAETMGVLMEILRISSQYLEFGPGVEFLPSGLLAPLLKRPSLRRLKRK